jgi:hypothetical protein
MPIRPILSRTQFAALREIRQAMAQLTLLVLG